MSGPLANRRRGEVAARIDGRDRILCLTLGALAELESAFAANNLVDLTTRFESGKLSAGDIISIITCGLRGAGETVGETEVAAMRVDGGAAGFARIAADLLTLTFGAAEAPQTNAESDPAGKSPAPGSPANP